MRLSLGLAPLAIVTLLSGCGGLPVDSGVAGQEAPPPEVPVVEPEPVPQATTPPAVSSDEAVDQLLGEAIIRIHEEKSISELFDTVLQKPYRKLTNY